MTLKRYHEKRDFSQTPEPKGDEGGKGRGGRFVIQKHDASHLHYDLRLEMGGVMKSWAIPKGPSRDPDVKRLAMHVEDHPMEYNTFEGHIPEGQYGAGDVIVWDKGTYHSLLTKNPKEAKEEFLNGLREGKFKFFLNGKKLEGAYSLYRFKNKDEKDEWILQKRDDAYVSRSEVTADPRSAISHKMLIGRNEDTAKYTKLIARAHGKEK